MDPELLARIELIHRLAHGVAHLTHSACVEIVLGDSVSTLGAGECPVSEPIQNADGRSVGELRVDGAAEARQRAMLRTMGLQVGPLVSGWPNPWLGEAPATSSYSSGRWTLELPAARHESDASSRRPIDALAAIVVSNAAHELRSPLTAVKMHADVLDSLVEGKQERQFLGVISGEAERMGALLDELRDAAWNPTDHTMTHRRR